MNADVSKTTVVELTAEELIHGHLQELVKLAMMAERHEAIVKGYKGFRIGENEAEFTLYNSKVKVVLTHDGFWTAERGKDWDYRMQIDKEEIFSLYKAEWKVAKESELKESEDGTSCLTEDGIKSKASEAFKEFIELISSK